MEAGDLGNTRETGETGDTINSRRQETQGTRGNTRESGDSGDTIGNKGDWRHSQHKGKQGRQEDTKYTGVTRDRGQNLT